MVSNWSLTSALTERQGFASTNYNAGAEVRNEVGVSLVWTLAEKSYEVESTRFISSRADENCRLGKLISEAIMYRLLD
ncbi:MAG: hypothetical protein C5B55_09730 [Blastocatellia bacterium]|nr:MAG: hypothetical protein C5B55_09730 [Blastocatellia bacterium]